MRCSPWFGGRRLGIFGDGRVQHGIELGDIIHLNEALLRNDKNGRSLGKANALAQSLVGADLGSEEAIGVDDEWHYAAVRLKVLLREGVEIFLRGDRDLVGEDSATVLFRGLRRDLVLDIAGNDSRVKAPDVHP